MKTVLKLFVVLVMTLAVVGTSVANEPASSGTGTGTSAGTGTTH